MSKKNTHTPPRFALPRLQRRGWRVLASVAVLSCALGAVSYAITRHNAYPVHTIKIAGELQHNEALVLKSLVETQLQGNFFTLDVGRIQSAVAELPWVRNVAVTRQWPDVVEVSLEEHKAKLIWNDKQLINEQGAAFLNNIPDEMTSLPRVHGPESAKEQVLALYQEYSERLSTVGQKLTQLDVDERYSVRAQTDNGTILILGREAPRQKLERYLTLYDGLLQSRAAEIGSIDWRYANGFAIHWNGDSKTQHSGLEKLQGKDKSRGA